MIPVRLLVVSTILGVLYVATVQREHRHAHRSPFLVKEGGPEPITMTPHIAGHVYRDGEPLSGAVVELREMIGAADGGIERFVISDQAGAFQIGEVPRGSYRITATAGGATSSTEFIAPLDEELPLSDLSLHLTSCDAPVVGTVVDQTGAPIAGAQIGADLIDMATSAADGSFRICLPDGDLRVSVRAAHHGGIVIRTSVPRAEPLRVVLAAEGTIEGTVVDEADRPVRGALVRVWGRDEASSYAISDHAGRFHLGELTAGTALLRVEADGLRRDDTMMSAEVSAGATTSGVMLRMHPRQDAILRGRVIVDGEPADDPIVTCGDVAIRSHEAGRFAMRAEVGCNLHVLGHEHPRRYFDGSDTDVRIEAHARVTVEGYAMRDGRPVPGALIDLTGPGVGFRRTRASASGRFSIEGAAPGTYRLSASLPALGLQTGPIELLMPPGGPPDVTLELVPVR